MRRSLRVWNFPSIRTQKLSFRMVCFPVRSVAVSVGVKKPLATYFHQLHFHHTRCFSLALISLDIWKSLRVKTKWIGRILLFRFFIRGVYNSWHSLSVNQYFIGDCWSFVFLLKVQSQDTHDLFYAYIYVKYDNEKNLLKRKWTRKAAATATTAVLMEQHQSRWNIISFTLFLLLALAYNLILNGCCCLCSVRCVHRSKEFTYCFCPLSSSCLTGKIESLWDFHGNDWVYSRA